MIFPNSPKKLHEVDKILGHRGARLGPVHTELLQRYTQSRWPHGSQSFL